MRNHTDTRDVSLYGRIQPYEWKVVYEGSWNEEDGLNF